MNEEDGHARLPSDEATLTLGKQTRQLKSEPLGSKSLTDEMSGDRLVLRWGAMLLYLLPDLDAHAEELTKILSLPIC